MRRIICVPFLLAALTALSVLPVQDCLAYGPGDSWYYGHYRRGGPGVEYDYGTAPSGTYDYGGPSAPQGNARVTADNTVRLIPALTLMCRTRPLPSLPPDTGGIPMTIIGTTGMTGTTRMTGVLQRRTRSTVRPGWRYSPGGWWFQLYGGSWLSGGWQLIHNRWYRFDQNGYMLTGWFTDSDNNRYYLNPLDDGTLG